MICSDYGVGTTRCALLPEEARFVPSHIVDDIAAIHARMLSIEAAERTATPKPDMMPQLEAPDRPATAPPADFYGWLMGGGLWSPTQGSNA